MARFTTVGGSGSGAPGPQGPAGQAGANGADALWNYLGEYDGGTIYTAGDVVTYDGQLWYRNVYTSAGYVPGGENSYWDLLAAKGTDGTNGSSGLVYLGNYISGNGYVTDLAVVRGSDNNLYIAKANGGLADPVGNTAEWDIFSTNTGGGTANIADFIFTDDSDNTGRSIISLPGDKGMTIAAGEDSDLYLTAGDDLYIETLGEGDDIHINAADDIRFSAANDLIDNSTTHYWRMDSDGEFHLPGAGYISNPIDSSGDGSGNDTLRLIPDEDLTWNGGDQYIIIDPTTPNHIHIRAGGEIDQSTAELILGGEDTYVKVSDTDDSVNILANNININSYASPSSLNINTYSGATIQSNRTSVYSDENKVVAVLGDIEAAVGVGGNGEVTRWSPNFEATGLAFTGTDTTYPTYNSHYVKNGRMLSFFIEIDMATVTNFGTGQYKTALPYAPLSGTMNHFQSWCLVDETANPDNTGHAILQADHLANTSVLDLHYIKQSGGANSPVMEALFKQGSPVTLTTATHIYINGTYITAE